MPRKAAVTPFVHIHTTIPANLATQLELFLFSEVEGCVPRGAYQAFLVERLKEFFAQTTLDLAPYTGNIPGVYIVRGSSETIELLQHNLEN